jgi:peptidoglycan hydrolase-like protein with peptidoglycan-binding domain
MKNPERWIAIIASLLTACVAQATTTKPAVHHPRERTAHATYRTVRYARQTSSTATSASHPSTAKKTHHYTHRRYARRHYHHHVVLPKGPTPERVTEIQAALARGGYYKGDPTGKWDSDTVAAVQRFQSANNIDSTGKLDAPTLQKLGLGSDIAGVAAPRQVVPKTCCSTGEPGAATPSVAPPATVPGKPAGAANPAPGAGHVQSASTSTGANASAANANSGNSGAGASSASAIAPSTTSGSDASDPASASKPAASQH